MVLVTTVFSLIHPVFAIPFIYLGMAKVKSNLKEYSFAAALFWALFGYSITSKGVDDLSRYFIQIQTYFSVPIKELLIKDRDLLFTRDILFRLIAVTGDVHLLPLLVGLLEYWMVFYVFFDFIDRNRDKVNGIDIFFSLVIIIGVVTPENIIGNTRCVFAFIIVVYAYYRMEIENKTKIVSYLLFIIAVGIHGAAIVVFFIALMSKYIHKLSLKYVFLILLLPGLTGLIYGMFKRSSMTFSFLKPVVLMVNRAYSYFNWTEKDWISVGVNSRFGMINKAYGSFFIILLLIMVFANRRNRISNEEKNLYDPMIRFIYMNSIVALGTLSIKLGVFWRFEAVTSLFAPLLILSMHKTSKQVWLKNILYVSTIVMLALNLIHMWTNVDMKSTLLIFFTNSPLVLILKGLLNVLR